MRLFQMQRFSAIALVVFMTIHMVVVHYPPFHIDFSRIIERLDQPLWKGIDIAFLFFVLVHALSGGYAVLMDIERVNAFKRLLMGVAVLVGIAAFVYGSITIMAFHPPSAVVVLP